jgi:hypothetical protein
MSIYANLDWFMIEIHRNGRAMRIDFSDNTRERGS